MERRSGSEWAELAAEYRASGWSQEVFCRRRGISLHSFRDWLYRRSRQRRPSSAERSITPLFLPVTMADGPGVASSMEPIEVVVDDRRRVNVRPGFDPTTLRQVVEVLEGSSC